MMEISVTLAQPLEMLVGFCNKKVAKQYEYHYAYTVKHIKNGTSNPPPIPVIISKIIYIKIFWHVFCCVNNSIN